ncbi:MAG TPA: nitroreductase [Oceanospirillaceae bacterium]|nr:nitroreductase [Oceanospirillaceae bacterium]
MELIHGLLNRVSIQRLEAPGPTEEQVEVLIQAALRAPDHANLKPWRSIMVAGEGLTRLGEVLQQAQLERNPDSDELVLDRCRKMPSRAPSVLVLVASPTKHPKVPLAEQIQAAAAAGYAIVLAAFAQGIGAVWRTGWVVEHQQVRQALKIEAHEQIIGMIYLGTPSVAPKPVPQIDSTNFITDWH